MRAIRQVLALVTVALLATITACGTSTNPAIGTWGSGGDGEPQLTLTHEGVVTGTDGCHRIDGTWDEDGDTVTFYDLAVTDEGCPDADTWPTAPATATVDGDSMHVLDADGADLSVLTRQ